MNRDELKKLIRGIIVATPTPFNDNLEVDYGKMADMTKWWISEGLVKSKAVTSFNSGVSLFKSKKSKIYLAKGRT